MMKPTKSDPRRVSAAHPKLLEKELHSARENGVLKVIVQPEGVSVEDIRNIAERQGWLYWRSLKRHGASAIELLVDLYHKPKDWPSMG